MIPVLLIGDKTTMGAGIRRAIEAAKGVSLKSYRLSFDIDEAEFIVRAKNRKEALSAFHEYLRDVCDIGAVYKTEEDWKALVNCPVAPSRIVDVSIPVSPKHPTVFML